MSKRKMAVNGWVLVRESCKGDSFFGYGKFLIVFCVRKSFLGNMYEYGGRRIMAEGRRIMAGQANHDGRQASVQALGVVYIEPYYFRNVA